MPDDNALLASIPIELPSVPSDKVVPPEVIVPDLLKYLVREGFKPDTELRFIRNALVERTLYLIWAFESDGEPAYATAAVRDREWAFGCGTNYWGLTPEQFIMASYHKCL